MRVLIENYFFDIKELIYFITAYRGYDIKTSIIVKIQRKK